MTTPTKASSDGSTGIVTVQNGQPQTPASDEYGRLWARIYVDVAPVGTNNPLPVASSGGVATQVEGNVANDAVDSGNPVKVGGVASTDYNGRPAVSAAGDRTNLATDLRGRVYALVGGMIAASAVADDVNAPPVSIGGTAASTAAGLAAVAVADRTVMATDVNGRLVVRATGGVAHDDANLSTCPPIKTGGRAAGNRSGFSLQVAPDDITDSAMNIWGNQVVALGGARDWTWATSDLATPSVALQITAAAAVLGSVSITLAEAVDMYVILFDSAAGVGGLVIDRFYVPASKTAVRDFMLDGGRYCGNGIYLAFSTTANAVTAPATGGFIHAVYQNA